MGRSWHINRYTLLPEITDIALFRAEFSDDPFLDDLLLLWTGDAYLAVESLRSKVRKDPENRRAKALLADGLRDLGQIDEAERIYWELVHEASSKLAEATYRQHLGKVYFVAGNLQSALEQFEHALQIRLEFKADEDLVSSARLAVERTLSLS